jgi:hypothetical protein
MHLAALEQAIADADLAITRLADLGGAHGYSQPRRITIFDSLSPADTDAVLVHEFAHLCSVVDYVRSGPGEVAPWRSSCALSVWRERRTSAYPDS